MYSETKTSFDSNTKSAHSINEFNYHTILRLPSIQKNKTVFKINLFNSNKKTAKCTVTQTKIMLCSVGADSALAHALHCHHLLSYNGSPCGTSTQHHHNIVFSDHNVSSDCTILSTLSSPPLANNADRQHRQFTHDTSLESSIPRDAMVQFNICMSMYCSEGPEWSPVT